MLGLQLWLGNNDHTQDIFRGDLHPIYNSAERENTSPWVKSVHAAEKQEAIAYMISHPAREARLITYRVISIWSGGTPYPLQDFLSTPSLQFRTVLLFNLVAALGALCGIIILFLERSLFAIPLAAFPLIYPWAYYLTRRCRAIACPSIRSCCCCWQSPCSAWRRCACVPLRR